MYPTYKPPTRSLKTMKHTPILPLIATFIRDHFNTPNFPTYPQSDHYNPKTRQFFNTPATRSLKSGVLREMWRLAAEEEQFHPPRPLPTVQPNWQAFHAPSETARFIWFGHSTLLMRLNNKTIFIDPVYYESASPVGLMMHRFQAPPVALADLPPIDFIVYSHAHYDHLDHNVVDYFAKNRPQAQFIAPLGLGAYLRNWGIANQQIQELDWVQSTEQFGITFHAVPARHDASRTAFDAKKSLWAGWVFETSQQKIYFSGDSSYATHFQKIGERFGGIDLAFVENGQYNPLWEDNHMFPAQTVQAALDVKAKCWMPIHWGAYPLSTHQWDESVRESSQIAAEKNLPMLTPMMGQVFDINTPTEKWWKRVK
ncbi:MBL fold metallo-hydrolase [Kingella negevensis]|uniref:MBL fold metallo-hydrolase n=2 Tax=Kingella negevensis TaxID=1522312 RepID=UPI00254C9BC3|nr:MBL fold metallo-hydrolase [Kingella negevensis]MDK4680107.1 MBL fold metallo-hydrolase [Kingella negevensis]MDK4682173.1 MBL fold metallo-hydrolase [Kingella negevensis]MDK4690370.1 MBL fold metallo-hydrolase [Kingella negevensis]MDK4698586.1 MBL fold metallo-hydrolase [Kingella negevensis]